MPQPHRVQVFKPRVKISNYDIKDKILTEINKCNTKEIMYKLNLYSIFT